MRPHCASVYASRCRGLGLGSGLGSGKGLGLGLRSGLGLRLGLGLAPNPNLQRDRNLDEVCKAGDCDLVAARVAHLDAQHLVRVRGAG